MLCYVVVVFFPTGKRMCWLLRLTAAGREGLSLGQGTNDALQVTLAATACWVSLRCWGWWPRKFNYMMLCTGCGTWGGRQACVLIFSLFSLLFQPFTPGSTNAWLELFWLLFFRLPASELGHFCYRLTFFFFFFLRKRNHSMIIATWIVC